MVINQETKQKGPNLVSLGIKSPMEVIDILGLLRIDGAPVIQDDKALLDPEIKARTVVEYFHRQFNVSPDLLPYLAAVIKKQLKNNWKGNTE